MGAIKEIAADDIRAGINGYEATCAITTKTLLELIANDDPQLATIPDAGFWRSSYDLLERLTHKI